MEFISIAKLLDAISQRIELPDDWDDLIGQPEPAERPLDQNAPLSRRLQNINIRMLRSKLATDYKESTAARGLDVVLINHAELCPPWYDLRDTGALKKNPACSKEVELILVFIANTFDRILTHIHANGWQPLHEASRAEYVSYDDAKRLREVGFYYSDLKVFFNQIQIDNPFDDETVDMGESQNGDVSTPEQKEPTASSGIITNRIEDEPHQHPLYDLIQIAKKTAKDPSQYQSIWIELVLLAKGDKPPAPMIGFVEREGIKYHSGLNVNNYTQDALRKYLDRAAKRRKKKADKAS